MTYPVQVPKYHVEYRTLRYEGTSIDNETIRLNQYARYGWRVKGFIPEGPKIGYYILERRKEREFQFDNGFISDNVIQMPGKWSRSGPRPRIQSSSPFINFIFRAIVAGHWSMERLAKAVREKTDVNMQPATINYWLRGENIPKLNTLQAVLSVLGFTLTIVPIDKKSRELMKFLDKEKEIPSTNNWGTNHASR